MESHWLEQDVTGPTLINPDIWLEHFSSFLMFLKTGFLEIKRLDFKNLSLSSRSPFGNVKDDHWLFFDLLFHCSCALQSWFGITRRPHCLGAEIVWVLGFKISLLFFFLYLKKYPWIKEESGASHSWLFNVIFQLLLFADGNNPSAHRCC